jgi:hypothetical protein
MQSNLLSVKSIRSCKCGKVNSDTVDVADSPMHGKNKIIHEHEFVTVRIKEANNFLINCITCGIYYCESNGRVIKKEFLD